MSVPRHTPPDGLTAWDLGNARRELLGLLKNDPSELEVENNPFAFTPQMLSKLHDPKNLNALRAMGGLIGLTMGLRSNLDKGLSPDEDKLEGRVALQDIWQYLEALKKGQIQETSENGRLNEGGHDKSKGINLLLDDSRVREKPKHAESGAAPKYSVSRWPIITSVRLRAEEMKGFSDRKRLFSDNRIPPRKSKTFFELMLRALHDRLLVRFPFIVFILLIDHLEYCSNNFSGVGVL